MVKKMKVYGVNYGGTHRRIVAATSQKAAAALIGVPVSHMRNYGSETGNVAEVTLAMSEPGAVFEAPMSGRGEYTRLPDKQERATS